MITYPVDLNARYTFKLGEHVRRNQPWPRADGGALVGQDEKLVILQETTGVKPSYDPATQYLAESWVDDDENQVATLTYTVTALDPIIAAKIAARAANDQKLADLGAAVATLRTWSSQAKATTVTTQNAVPTLQTVVTRLGTFFDHFANLLEAQNIK